MSDEETTSASPAPQKVEDFGELFRELAAVGNRVKAALATPEARRMFEAINEVALQVRAFTKHAQANIVPFLTIMKEMAAREELFALISRAGWLPHQTTPQHLLNSTMPLAEVHQVLNDFYANETDRVEQSFFESLNRYALDDQVRSTFTEALKCHRMGCYRATVRLLFPEIERVACIQLYDETHRGKASLPDFAELVGRLPLGQFPDVEAPLQLFEKLEGHMYMSVWDKTALQKVADDPVPNRHAAIHGFVDYSCMQNSINALIMADFMFQLFSTLKSFQHMSDDGI